MGDQFANKQRVQVKNVAFLGIRTIFCSYVDETLCSMKHVMCHENIVKKNEKIENNHSPKPRNFIYFQEEFSLTC